MMSEQGPHIFNFAESGRRCGRPASSLSLTLPSGAEVGLWSPGSGQEHRMHSKCCAPASPDTALDCPSRVFSMGAGSHARPLPPPPRPQPAPLAGILFRIKQTDFLEI